MAHQLGISIKYLKQTIHLNPVHQCNIKRNLKRGDRRVRIFSAHNNWWVTPEVSLPLPYQRSANVFLNFLRQGVKIMYYCKNMHSKSLKCAK